MRAARRSAATIIASGASWAISTKAGGRIAAACSSSGRQGGRPGFRHSVELILVGPAATLRTDDFAGLAGGFIDSGTATYLQVSHGPGFLPFRAFLNRTLGPSVAARDYAEMKRLIWAAYARMQDQPRIAATVEHFMADGAAVPLPMKD